MAVFLLFSGLFLGLISSGSHAGVTVQRSGQGASSILANARGAEIDSAAVLKVSDDPFLISAENAGQSDGSMTILTDIPYISYESAAIQDPGLIAGAMPGAPAALSSQKYSNTTSAALPNFDANFIMPTKGYNWGILHDHNAVDIANSCGTPVVAAAEGLVVPDPNFPNISSDDWNAGYGNFVLIEHPFGNQVDTRYTHLSTVSVHIGDYVKQGQQIGLMGKTGDATGCHVHFEVLGAHNPFAKH